MLVVEGMSCRSAVQMAIYSLEEGSHGERVAAMEEQQDWKQSISVAVALPLLSCGVVSVH